MLSGKTVLIGITGAIAAYKSIELIRLFKKNGANVKVVVTPNAFKFVTEVTLRTLSENEVFCEQFSVIEFKPEHIALTKGADLFVIAPITANTIGKLANGICDNLLTSVACAFQKPVLLAPCMNTGMWDNQKVQENIASLKQRGIFVIEPEIGYLACGDNGKGRLADINDIFEKAKEILIPNQFLKGKKIIITAGGTKENIDAVRYIGNYSSGKTGIALADSAFQLGADVVLISTVEVNRQYTVIKVKTAEEMYSSVNAEFKNADILIMAAAVSDYRVKNKSEQKIKKNGEPLTIELVENPDILKSMCEIKQDNQKIIGFCAESENLIDNAKQKIESKKCDFIVANDISNSKIGFSSEYNEVFIIDKAKNITKLNYALKTELAKKILEVTCG